MENRRNFARVDHELLVGYTHFDMQKVKDDEGVAKTLNMSVRGLLLLLPRSVEVDTELQIALNLDGEIVEVVGRVVRCELDRQDKGMFDAGIELAYVPDRFTEAVERYFGDG